ncbi:hypothetical protein GOP47_0004051 [Adiantum capillus-veneris]|uniref:Protein ACCUMULATION AND REPLICATION OF CHLOROPLASTS 3 n=1 Tax=Adiantum capillus-veneris TaxID=13818 RepID=A0A9D4V827_ADICA|nr:hypothetical protein GOP47_0004051 [Adiantum capillus-veneris]
MANSTHQYQNHKGQNEFLMCTKSNPKPTSLLGADWSHMRALQWKLKIDHPFLSTVISAFAQSQIHARFAEGHCVHNFGAAEMTTGQGAQAQEMTYGWHRLRATTPYFNGSTWRFAGNLFCASDNKLARIVVDSLTDWSSGQCVKVVGLGTRASTALQFCHESELLQSVELWVSSGDGTDLQSFGLLNKNHVKIANGRASQKEQKIFILVLGMGANSFGKEVSDMLQINKAQSSLSLMIIIEPFNFEGPKRKKEVEEFAESLLDRIDMCLVFELDVLFKREKVTLAEALRVADSTVLYAIKAVSDMVLGDQLKVCDAPPEGLREISNSEILSRLEYAGNTWAGFGLSYSIKSAVKRAALESPFLRGLIPGVKGVVVCTIASADEKGKQDIQAAVHALRCTIGPRAQLICTSVKEPHLKRGLILATVLLTRLDDGGGHDVSKQCTTAADFSSPGGFFSGGSMGYSQSLNGRELRRASMEVPMESTDIQLLGRKQQDVSEPVSLNSTDEALSELNAGDTQPPNGTHESADMLSSQNDVVQDGSEGSKTAKTAVAGEWSPMFKLATAVIENRVLTLSSPSDGVVQGLFAADGGTFEEEGVLNDLRRTSIGTVEDDDLNAGLDGDSSADLEGQIDSIETQAIAFGEDDLALEKDVDERWRFPSLSTLVRSKENFNGEKKGIFGWESGPHSAAAEAWARARQQLGNLGTLERNISYKLPIGVRSISDLENGTLTYDREESRKQDNVKQATLFSFAAPLGRVLASGLETVTDIYNAASSRIFKKEEDDDVRQASSFLSERASSMLESERSSMKLPPMVEMRYKNGMYKGRCQEGLPEGKGRLSYEDGSFYYGLWKQGKRAGMGSFYYANGDVFQGYWRDDQKHGKGWFYFHTGDRLYADFWKGKANGEGRYYSAEGDVFFGYFKENWRHGEALSIESGVRWSEIWDQGVLILHSRFEDNERN